MTSAPKINSSSAENRKAFVSEQWECIHNCTLCGKCHFLMGRDPEELYADYINGSREYIDITKEIRG